MLIFQFIQAGGNAIWCAGPDPLTAAELISDTPGRKEQPLEGLRATSGGSLNRGNATENRRYRVARTFKSEALMVAYWNQHKQDLNDFPISTTQASYVKLIRSGPGGSVNTYIPLCTVVPACAVKPSLTLVVEYTLRGGAEQSTNPGPPIPTAD